MFVRGRVCESHFLSITGDVMDSSVKGPGARAGL